tara:strand:+ start:38365 stop:39204 length:840 start_codon:yes stop_codon:yes gene_type:complete
MTDAPSVLCRHFFLRIFFLFFYIFCIVMKFSFTPFALVASLIALPISLQSATVSIPYSNDFSSSVADFTENPGAEWTLDSGAGVFTYSNSEQATSGTAMVTASGLGSTYADFSISTTFTVTATNSGTSNWGMALLGNSETPSDFILVDFSSNRTLRAINLGGTGTGSTVNDSKTSSLSFSTGTSYTLTANGSYSGTVLTLTLDLTNGVSSDSIVITPFDTAATGYDGSAMGLRARSGSGSGGTTVQYDSFSIVPEPSMSALFLGAATGFLVLGRRSRRS